MGMASEFREFIARGNVADLAVGVVSGLGAHGYELALEYALRHLQDRTPHGSQKTEKTH